MVHSQDQIGTWIQKPILTTIDSLLAIHKGSKISSTCIKGSFEYALARDGENILHKIKGII